MGLASARISLSNPRLESLKPLEVEALADNGKRVVAPYVGPIYVHFENRDCDVGAIVSGDQVLLGAIPMEDLDLVVVPLERRIAVNPPHPNIAAGLAR